MGNCRSLADIGQQGHEARPLDRVFHGALESRTVAAPLAAKDLALAGAHLLQTGHIFIIDKGRPRATFLRAEPTAVLTSPSEFLTNHEFPHPQPVSDYFSSTTKVIS